MIFVQVSHLLEHHVAGAEPDRFLIGEEDRVSLSLQKQTVCSKIGKQERNRRLGWDARDILSWWAGKFTPTPLDSCLR